MESFSRARNQSLDPESFVTQHRSRPGGSASHHAGECAVGVVRLCAWSFRLVTSRVAEDIGVRRPATASNAGSSAIPAADQRQGGTLQPHAARGVRIFADPQLQHRTPGSLDRLPPRQQPSRHPRLTRRASTHLPCRWTLGLLHLARGRRGRCPSSRRSALGRRSERCVHRALPRGVRRTAPFSRWVPRTRTRCSRLSTYTARRVRRAPDRHFAGTP